MSSTARTSVVSRRNLVKGATLAAGAALAACAFQPKPVLAADEVSFDEECDVLVVGSGYAGLAAAYEAAKAGAAVRVIDKRSFFGGNSYVADGQIAVVGSAAQRAAGVEDSVDALVSDMLAAGLNLNYVDKCRLIGEKSNETFEWTVNEIGVEWAQDPATGAAQLIAQGGHSIMRCIPPLVNKGSGIIDPLGQKLSEMGVEVETDTMLVNLVKDAEGRVVGAQVALDVVEDDVDTASATKTIKVDRGVVMATGGYGADVAWRSAHDPRLDETVGNTNREGATAAGLAVAMAAGALAIQLDQIQCYPYTSPDEASMEAAGFPPLLSDSLVAATENYSHFLFWFVAVVAIRMVDWHPYRLAALTELCMSAVAFVFGLMLQGSGGLARFVGDGALYAVVIIALALLWRMRSVAIETPQVSDASSVCARIAAAHGLSPRETQVFTLLAQGRSRVFIQEELSLSDSTIKAHTSHVYQKLGVHSKQELISLVQEG